MKGPAVPQTAQGRWYVSQHKQTSSAAFDLGCRIYLALLGQQSPLWKDVNENDFFIFTRALEKYQRYLSLTATAQEPTEAAAAVKEAGELTGILSSRKSSFAYAHKLAAYIHREQGRLAEAKVALEEYLRLLKDQEQPTDDEARELLASLQQRLPTVAAVETATVDAPRGKVRPLKPGTSISVGNRGPGTITCFVKDSDGINYLLSADHVLVGTIGDRVLQPGSYDGGSASDAVATLSRIDVKKTSGRIIAAAGLAKIDNAQQFSNEIPGIGKITGIAIIDSSSMAQGTKIRTLGRTSGLKESVIRENYVDIEIHSATTNEFEGYSGMIRTPPFSEAGDSGAPVVTEDGRLIGFVYAGSSDATIVMPIEPVLRALNVSLID
jgi:hypothetical protein